MSIAPSQILYLDQGASRLYAEAIQIVERRQLCWARPTLLIEGLPAENSLQAGRFGPYRENDDRQSAIAAAAASSATSALVCYDLEDCPDLIWPAALFNVATDIDFFALLIQLQLNPDEKMQSHSRQQLNDFIRTFWSANADAFAQDSLEPLPATSASSSIVLSS